MGFESKTGPTDDAVSPESPGGTQLVEAPNDGDDAALIALRATSGMRDVRPSTLLPCTLRALCSRAPTARPRLTSLARADGPVIPIIAYMEHLEPKPITPDAHHTPRNDARSATG
jgi:hypothetical protein